MIRARGRAAPRRRNTHSTRETQPRRRRLGADAAVDSRTRASNRRSVEPSRNIDTRAATATATATATAIATVTILRTLAIFSSAVPPSIVASILLVIVVVRLPPCLRWSIARQRLAKEPRSIVSARFSTLPRRISRKSRLVRVTADIVLPVARFVRVSLGSCLGCLFGTGEKVLPQEDVGESVSHD